ncbi:MAG: hypothetical protein HWD59_07465 [Coxiellaceae bacterium]|nr:MAG: hypothetical protein HWD59_07465 [Coxiellaceae bacterium]
MVKKVDKIYEDLSGRILQAFTVLLQKFQQLPMLVSSGQIATESFDQLLDLKRKIKAIFTCIDVVSNYWGTSENFSSICNDLKK